MALAEGRTRLSPNLGQGERIRKQPDLKTQTASLCHHPRRNVRAALALGDPAVRAAMQALSPADAEAQEGERSRTNKHIT